MMSTQLLTDTLEEAPIGIAMLDRCGMLREANQRLCDILGYTQQELIGQKMPEMSYPVVLDTVLRQGTWIGEVWNYRKNGEAYRSLSTITAIKDELGLVSHYVGTQIDITSHHVIDKKLFTELRTGIKKKEFELYYQPQFTSDNQVISVEALIRWQHPRCGLLRPSQFISLAEETGLIVPLGNWVLKMACVQLASWAGSPLTANIGMAVNVSAAQLRQPNYVSNVLSIIEEAGANPNKLTLEITESLLLDDVSNLVVKMQQLQTHGITFSLDDFGVGYSSLSYLKRLPVNQLKIDKSFMTGVLSNNNDASIIVAIIAFGKSLGLSVIAEGVEMDEQRQFLVQHDCHVYQGSLFCDPLPVTELEQFLRSRTS